MLRFTVIFIFLVILLTGSIYAKTYLVNIEYSGKTAEQLLNPELGITVCEPKTYVVSYPVSENALDYSIDGVIKTLRPNFWGLEWKLKMIAVIEICSENNINLAIGETIEVQEIE